MTPKIRDARMGERPFIHEAQTAEGFRPTAEPLHIFVPPTADLTEAVFVDTLIAVNTWDETKRIKTLHERGLDFADAEQVFEGSHYDRMDDREDYGEPRFITAGWLEGRFVVVVWTPRHGGRRIISMRHGHGFEEERYRRLMGRPG